MLEHLSNEESREDFLKRYQVAKPIIERILEILSKDLSKNVRESDSVSHFDKPDWALYQAYQSGVRKSIRDLTKLLNQKVDHDL